MVSFIAFVVGAALGFAVGRIKNAAKLAAIKAEIAKVDAFAVAEVKALVEKIKSLL